MQSIDIEAARKRFEDARLPGAIKLIDFLQTSEGKKLSQVYGSAIIPDDPYPFIMSLGASDDTPNVTPLEDLVELSTKLSEFDENQLIYCDLIMEDYVINRGKTNAGTKVATERYTTH